jgi:hypothetical protein
VETLSDKERKRGDMAAIIIIENRKALIIELNHCASAFCSTVKSTSESSQKGERSSECVKQSQLPLVPSCRLTIHFRAVVKQTAARLDSSSNLNVL